MNLKPTFPSHISTAIVFLLSLLILGACGGSQSGPGLLTDRDGTDAERSASFTLSAPGPDQTAGLTVKACELSGQTVVNILATEQLSTESILFELHYDAAGYSPRAVQATAAFAAPTDCLSLEILTVPGVVSFGQIPLESGSRAVAAGTKLAEVLFTAEPFSAAHQAAEVPVHSQALCPLTYDATTGELSLYYVNTGDYDQNGVVSVSDLSPLGRHFGSAGPFAFNSVPAVIDGNRNGQIEVADLTMIGQYWGNDVTGFNFYGSNSIGDVPLGYAEESAIDPLGSLLFTEATGDAAGDRLVFTFATTDFDPCNIYWARPFADGREGIASNLAGPEMLSQPDVPTNIRPVAQLELEYTSTEVPAVISFDAGGSADSDGLIVLYEWDFEGDGRFDGRGDSPVAEYTYTQPGTYQPLVRVTDNLGAWDIYQTQPLELTGTAPNTPPEADLIATVRDGVAPLLVGLMASGSTDADGYITNYEWDFDGDGTYDLDSGTDSTIIYSYGTAGKYTTAVRVTDNGGASDVESVTITVAAAPAPNDAPTAAIAADRLYGTAPLTVAFDAGGSTDPDGDLVHYEWDFDGDGNYDSYGPTAALNHLYQESGVFAAKVRITDDGGATDVASTLIHVNESLDGEMAWPMYGHDQRHTGRSPFYGPATNALKWSVSLGGPICTTPAIGTDGTLYVGTRLPNNHLYAINADGTIQWTHEMERSGWVHSSAAIDAEGMIYVGSFQGYVHALNQDGDELWSYDTQYGDVSSSPVIGDDGTIYVGTDDRYLHAFNPDGSFKWSYLTGGELTSSPAIGPDGTIFASSMDKRLYAINPDGTLRWTFLTSGQLHSSPAVDPDGTVYFGSYDNRLYAVSSTGEYMWYFTTGGIVWASPAIGVDGTIYVGSNDGNLYAINPDGSLHWSLATGDAVASPTIGADGTVYVGSCDDKVYAVNPDGTVAWTYTTGDDVSAAPVLGSDGTLYVASWDGRLYAFGPGTNPTPTPPLNLQASDDTYHECISLTWEQPIAGATPDGYQIYRSESETGPYVLVAYTNNPTSYNDYAPGFTEYWYEVRAYRTGGYTSDYSNSDAGRRQYDPAPGDWNMFGRDLKHQRRSPFNGPVDANLRWLFPTGDSVYSSPAIRADGTIYVGCDDGNLYAINPGGSLLWTFNTQYNPSSISSSPAIGPDGTVYVGTGSYRLYAINPDGSVKWLATPMSDTLTSPAIGADGTVYIGGDNGYLYAYNPDGTAQWSYSMEGPLEYSSPAIADDGTIYIGCGTRLYAVNSDGSGKWSYESGDQVYSSPAIGDDGTVYFGGFDNKLHAVNPDGSQQWTYETGDYIFASPAIATDGTVYIGCADGYIHAVAPDGTTVWSYDAGTGALSSPTVGADGTIYLVSGQRISAFASDGTLLWYANIGSLGLSSPAIAPDGTLYAGGTVGGLYAFGTALN